MPLGIWAWAYFVFLIDYILEKRKFRMFFSESHLGEDEQPLLILDQARIQGRQFCAFAFQRKDSQNAWPLQMGIDLSKSS